MNGLIKKYWRKNYMNKYVFYLILILLSMNFFSACKSKKKLAAPITNKDTTVVAKTDTYAADKLLRTTLTNWQYFSAKAEIDYDDGNKSISVGANFRMLKDSLLWVSVNIFGIEGGRILINKDSLVFMDKLHKEYMVYYSKDIVKLIGMELTVGQIQNIILAKPLFALTLFELLKNTESEISIQDNSHEKFILNHHYQKQFLTLDKTYIKDRTTPNYATVLYNNYSNVNNHNFPYKSDITAFHGKNTSKINIVFEKPDFETSVTFPFSIPPSYDRK